MLPAVNKQQELTQHLSLNPQKKQLQPVKKKRKQWKETYELTGMGTPEVIQSPTFKKMFKLRFTYKDTEQPKKRHTHVVYFGDKADFIFNGNKQARVRRILKMKNIDNPFHSDYWSAHLANKYSTLKQGIQKFTQFFINNNNKELAKKQASQVLTLK